jgi:hypothetical protein
MQKDKLDQSQMILYVKNQTKSAQGFGFNSGVGFYNIGSGSGSPTAPDKQGRGS